MTAEFHHLEISLKEALIEANSDSYNSKNANLYKYNNLKVYMDPKKEKTPHFIVCVGISESMYAIDGGERLSGGLGSDERYIHKWFEKLSIKSELSEAWKKSQKFEVVQMKNDVD